MKWILGVCFFRTGFGKSSLIALLTYLNIDGYSFVKLQFTGLLCIEA
jgi:hypothetical protein